MRALHALCGFRSGSTLLQALLCQNPRFWASSTSALCDLVVSVQRTTSSSPEVKSDKAHDRRWAEARELRTMRSIVEAHYHPEDDPRLEGREVLFDKSRGWARHHVLLRQLAPEAVVVLCVRDLRDIFCSVVRAYARHPYDELPGETLERRRDRLFGIGAFAGQPSLAGSWLLGIRDLAQRGMPRVQVVQYEQLVRRPEAVLRALYEALQEPYFPHDFRSVPQVATDNDAQHGFVFSHQVRPVVAPPPRHHRWDHHMTAAVVAPLYEAFPGYMAAFSMPEHAVPIDLVQRAPTG